MVNKSVWAILAGMLGVGEIGGTTLAMLQQQSQSPAASSATQTVKPAGADSPVATTTPAATTPIETANRRPEPIAATPPVRPMNIRTVNSCRIVMAIVNDSTPLNVRSQPNTSTGKILTTLADGTFVNVKQEADGWLEITNPPGWIAKSKTVSRCGEKLETIQLPDSGQAEISDEFLGTGSHKYQLAMTQGQTLTIQGQAGPLPGLIAPNGQYLIGMDEKSGEWTQTIPSNGTYTLEMASNFRGYRYRFTIVRP